MTAKSRKTLFLVDAMGYIFRAYYAPMGERFEHKGIPTKVPYIFATMMRRLIEGQKPDYLFIQVPFVRRYCEAMRLPILELAGYEADDVIASLARQGVEQNLDIFIVTADKDFMQLVDGRVKMLNPSKGDLIIDEKKVEELMGV